MIGPASTSARTKCTVQPWKPDAGLERPPVGVETAEGGQQRGMDVEQPVAPAVDQGRTQYTHEAGEANEFYFIGL